MSITESLVPDGSIRFIRGFLSPAECVDWISQSESAGFEEATINTARGQLVAKGVRNNDRLIWDDVALAEAWWERARGHIPSTLRGWEAVGLNERFRFYRYGAGQRFAQHRDGSFERSRNESSWLTFMVYLNQDFQGGTTKFDVLGLPEPLVVQPVAGAALLFKHDYLHAGEPVISGRKYVLRTDVMYRFAKADPSRT